MLPAIPDRFFAKAGGSDFLCGKMRDNAAVFPPATQFGHEYPSDYPRRMITLDHPEGSYELSPQAQEQALAIAREECVRALAAREIQIMAGPSFWETWKDVSKQLSHIFCRAGEESST